MPSAACTSASRNCSTTGTPGNPIPAELAHDTVRAVAAGEPARPDRLAARHLDRDAVRVRLGAGDLGAPLDVDAELTEPSPQLLLHRGLGDEQRLHRLIRRPARTAWW